MFHQFQINFIKDKEMELQVFCRKHINLNNHGYFGDIKHLEKIGDHLLTIVYKKLVDLQVLCHQHIYNILLEIQKSKNLISKQNNIKYLIMLFLVEKVFYLQMKHGIIKMDFRCNSIQKQIYHLQKQKKDIMRYNIVEKIKNQFRQ